MSWNYRVRKSRQRMKFSNGHRIDETGYELIEVHYTKAGKPRAYCAHARTPYGTTVDELRHVLTDMLAATYKPVFDFKKERAAKEKPCATSRP